MAVLRHAGHQAVLATEQAGPVPAADPRLLTGVLFGQLGAGVIEGGEPYVVNQEQVVAEQVLDDAARSCR